jgi:hypothetical protein
MNKLGNPRRNKVVGFFRPVREKAEIEAELAALEEAESRASLGEHELTD